MISTIASALLPNVTAQQDATTNRYYIYPTTATFNYLAGNFSNDDAYLTSDPNATPTSNESNFYTAPTFPGYIRNTSMVFCIVIMCLGVIGNVMVPIVILRTKDMRNSTNIFLINLSIADLMVLLVCTPTVLVEVNSRPETWILGEEMCKAVPFVELTVAHASVLTILAISFERYYAICEPLRAGYVCTKARASCICLMAWFFAAVFTSPILSLSTYQYEEYTDGSLVPVCWTPVDSFFACSFFLFIIAVFFFLPLAILIILYTLIARTLMNHPSILAPPRNTNVPQTASLKCRKQVIIMLGTVVLAFFICLLPFRALTLWIIIVPTEDITSLSMEWYWNLLYSCRIMFHLNSAINPILYNLMSSKFREGFLKLCGVNRSRLRKYRIRNNCERSKSGHYATVNSTTNNSVTHTTTDSFWRRLSNRNTSQKSGNSNSPGLGLRDGSGKVIVSSNTVREDGELMDAGEINTGNDRTDRLEVKCPYMTVPFNCRVSKRYASRKSESYV